jgi:hypothetical protein
VLRSRQTEFGMKAEKVPCYEKSWKQRLLKRKAARWIEIDRVLFARWKERERMEVRGR